MDKPQVPSADDELKSLVGFLFEAIAIHGGKVPDNPAPPTIDASLARQALVYVLAMFVESDRAVATPRDIRRACEAEEQRLKQMVKQLRAWSDENGQHVLETFGVSKAEAAPTSATKQ